MSLPSVDRFKNTLLNGGARANYFLVNGPAVGGDLTYLCRAASIPAATVTEVPVMTPGGRKIVLAGERTFEAWTITVYNDTQMIMRRRFEAWQAQCASYDNPLGADPLDAHGQSDWVVTQLSRSGGAMRSYQFYNMWPSSLGAIELSFDEQSSIEQFECTMSYSHYTPLEKTLGKIDSKLVFNVSVALSGGLGGGGGVAAAVNVLGGINGINAGGGIAASFGGDLPSAVPPFIAAP